MNNTCSDLALTRQLPVHTFAEICTWILEHTSYKLAFMGTMRDRDGIERFIAGHSALYKQKHKLLNIAGVLDFESYYHFISDKGACMVTIDSAPLHIARKLGVPTISIWGPTDPANHLKIKAGEEHRHLYQYTALPCSPCVHRVEQLPCGGNNFCMKTITATAVVEQLSSVLNQLHQTA
jgi:ADP-heptose:LPS heptosyltransferase